MKLVVGNAYKMEAHFSDWEDKELIIDPTVVKFKILDIQFNSVEEHILGPQNRIAKGVYQYFFVPSKPGMYYYEWWADIEGLPSLIRESFSAVNV